MSFSAEAGQDTRPTLTIGALTDKFQPTTEMEREMDVLFSALRRQDAGVASDGLAEDEGLTKEEYDKRQGEMAKLRALMSYHDKVCVWIGGEGGIQAQALRHRNGVRHRQRVRAYRSLLTS